MTENTPKLVFVSGASRGIGKGIADWFIDRGYLVAYGYLKNNNFDIFHQHYLNFKNIFNKKYKINT